MSQWSPPLPNTSVKTVSQPRDRFKNVTHHLDGASLAAHVLPSYTMKKADPSPNVKQTQRLASDKIGQRSTTLPTHICERWTADRGPPWPHSCGKLPQQLLELTQLAACLYTTTTEVPIFKHIAHPAYRQRNAKHQYATVLAV